MYRYVERVQLFFSSLLAEKKRNASLSTRLIPGSNGFLLFAGRLFLFLSFFCSFLFYAADALMGMVNWSTRVPPASME